MKDKLLKMFKAWKEKTFTKQTAKGYFLSNLLWLILGVAFTSNLFFSGSRYDVNFNLFELVLAALCDIMFIGSAFFDKRMGRLFDIFFGE